MASVPFPATRTRRTRRRRPRDLPDEAEPVRAAARCGRIVLEPLSVVPHDSVSRPPEAPARPRPPLRAGVLEHVVEKLVVDGHHAIDAVRIQVPLWRLEVGGTVGMIPSGDRAPSRRGERSSCARRSDGAARFFSVNRMFLPSLLYSARGAICAYESFSDERPPESICARR
jgi:hypothetical protein